MSETLKFIRADSTPHVAATRLRRDDPRMGSCAVTLDADPPESRVRAIVLGVADERAVQLAGGRVGAVDGPHRLRDWFFRLPAPPEFGPLSVLNAGDLQAADHTSETQARLAEVIAVLRDRFPRARVVVVGGGHDHCYGEVLGLARSVARGDPAARTALLDISHRAGVRPSEHDRREVAADSQLRRLLLEPAARLDGQSTLVWGLQRSANSVDRLQFLHQHGARTQFWEDIESDERRAAEGLTRWQDEAAHSHAGLAMTVDLTVFGQVAAPGVSDPVAIGVAPGAVVRAAAHLTASSRPTVLGLHGLNPRFDQDGATARLAARLAWSYLTGWA